MRPTSSLSLSLRPGSQADPPPTGPPARRTNFVLTASIDGVLKFWKKQADGIEFVKLYRTHLAPIVSVGVSDDGKSCASLGADSGGKTAEGLEVKGSAKVFDVENFGASIRSLLLLLLGPSTDCARRRAAQT
mgnify:CR=1 FL=1